MSSHLKRFKDLVASINNGASCEEPSPEIGFKIAFSPNDKQLKIRIISARHLPSHYGTTKAQGFLTKVTLFPGREKCETQSIKDSNPSFNQEFCFDLRTGDAKKKSVFKGKFVVLTVYALLEKEQKGQKLKKSASFRDQIRSFVSGNNENEVELRRNGNERRSMNRISFNNRRTIGAVTYNLETKNFTLKLKNSCVGTPDIWRKIQSISSGIQHESKESKLGSLEVTLTYSSSEDGNNEMIEVCLSKFRCSMQNMQDHEKFGGPLYLKVTAFERDVLIGTWKSDRFEPTISMRIESKTATLSVIFKRYNMDNVKIVIRLMCKNVLAKKYQLGRIEINNSSDLWRRIIDNPSTPITEMIHLE